MITVKCDCCGMELEVKIGEWTKCECGCSLKPEYRLVVNYGGK